MSFREVSLSYILRHDSGPYILNYCYFHAVTSIKVSSLGKYRFSYNLFSYKMQSSKRTSLACPYQTSIFNFFLLQCELIIISVVYRIVLYFECLKFLFVKSAFRTSLTCINYFMCFFIILTQTMQ